MQLQVNLEFVPYKNGDDTRSDRLAKFIASSGYGGKTTTEYEFYTHDFGSLEAVLGSLVLRLWRAEHGDAALPKPQRKT